MRRISSEYEREKVVPGETQEQREERFFMSGYRAGEGIAYKDRKEIIATHIASAIFANPLYFISLEEIGEKHGVHWTDLICKYSVQIAEHLMFEIKKSENGKEYNHFVNESEYKNNCTGEK
jgi:hypothetical protein